MPGLQTLVAVLGGIALAGAPLPLLAAAPAATKTAAADPAATPEPAEADPAEGEPADGEPAAEPAADDEDPLAEPAPKTEAAPAAAATPAPAPKQKREPTVDPLGLGLALGGYAMLAVSIGLFAAMGVELGNGEEANDTIQSTTTPDTELQRIAAFSAGRDANTAARNYGIAAGVVFVVGIALVGAGHGIMAKKKRERRNNAQISPTFGPREAGMSLRFSF